MNVRVERGAVTRITLARPERRNALDAQMIAELTDSFLSVDDARVVVFSGDGPSFCAGADIGWMRASVDLSYEENVEDALELRALFDAVDGCEAPVVAQVHGHALGGGCGLVAVCDIVVAAGDTVFGFTETKLGIVPAVISPFVLAKIGSAA
ncbi:MAG: enoyl-CoA hydratase/isomerase family protein, partial [Actinobacteria bacterium]|nr:enoyl-CoA hydratase/isomerase family protein [Actinomycetota bacterium]